MSRTTHKPSAVAKPLSLWGLLLGLPALASLALLSTGQGGTGDGGTGDDGGTNTGSTGHTSGGGGGNTGGGNTGGGSTNTDALTQAQWNAAWAREKANEAKTVETRMLKTLGYDSIEDAQAAAEARRVEAEKNLSDAQKATKRAEEAEAKARDRETMAAATERRAQVTLALAGAAVRPDRITQATTLLLADLDPAADEKAITEAVKAQTTAMPEFYGTSNGDGVDIAGRGRSGGKGAKDSYAAGLADGEAARKATNGTTTFLAGFPGYPSGS